MEGNKDDALKCLKIGREAIEIGDRIRALKFITKARRLDPTLPIEDLLQTLERESVSPPPDSASPKPASNPSVRHRAASSGSSSSSTPNYTEEQISIVRQIRRQKDYYEILGLEKSCCVEEVRKAYRKLSLKVHPDKNKAPGSEEAFKAVSKAFQCLSDEESKKRYDLVGSEEVVYERRAERRAPQGFYEADINAEEIFRNFFFGGSPGTTTQFRGFNFGTGMGPSVRTGDHGSNNYNLRTIIQLIPVILVILLNFLPSSEPIYALSRSYAYEHEFSTQRGVNYYVKTMKFEQEYPPNSSQRVALEQEVERDYSSILAQNCRVELQRYQWGFIHETPHCDMLKQFKARA